MTISNIVILFNIVAIFTLAIVLIHCFYILYRNDKVYDSRCKVIDAICKYQFFCINNNIPIEVEFNDMEEYEETLYKRPFDFSCEHILPEEKYELIREFM